MGIQRVKIASAFPIGWVMAVLISTAAASSGHGEWNQWLGGAARRLQAHGSRVDETAPHFKESWRRPLGSGFAGVSVFGTKITQLDLHWLMVTNLTNTFHLGLE